MGTFDSCSLMHSQDINLCSWEYLLFLIWIPFKCRWLKSRREDRPSEGRRLGNSVIEGINRYCLREMPKFHWNFNKKLMSITLHEFSGKKSSVENIYGLGYLRVHLIHVRCWIPRIQIRGPGNSQIIIWIPRNSNAGVTPGLYKGVIEVTAG